MTENMTIAALSAKYKNVDLKPPEIMSQIRARAEKYQNRNIIELSRGRGASEGPSSALSYSECAWNIFILRIPSVRNTQNKYI